MDNLQSILNEITKYDGESTVIFFLEENEYGYGYTYEVDNGKVNSTMLQDRFSEEEILSEGLDDMIGEENRQAYVDSHDNNVAALSEVISFWPGKNTGKLDKTLDMKTAVEIGRREKLDFIVF
ncbi:hypothetical protein [Bacillus toyonensis]|uniref:hypothetical protein n=1 Tax=Bacillus toyonensis TaxID=155322 RepID=UPI002E22B0B2|nr:hypothetical protein [Bacillus toyonensis]